MRRVQKMICSLLLTLPLTSFAAPQPALAPLDHTCLKTYQINNFEKAMAICLPAAQDHNPEAQYVVGMLYKRGKGAKRSESQAMQWLSKAADNGYPAAQLKLGRMLCTTTHPDYDKAFDYFLSAAEQNVYEAQFLVALCYQNGLGTSKNPVLALQWYHQAIANGLDAPPLHVKEKAPLKMKAKNSITNDDFIGLKLAAERGDASAQFEVAKYYLNGQETDQDDAKALNYFKAAANIGNQQAKSYLAWMTMLGLGAPQDMPQAIYWFVSCYDDAQAQIPMAVEPASQQEAKDQIASFYHQALKMLEDNDLDSQKQGIALLTHAANSNYVNAQIMLAKAYQTGKWVKQNATQAAHWYEKAAHHGSSDAQYALGWIYFNGEGVPKDVALSYFWFDKASHFGGPKAKSAKKFVQAYMSPSQKSAKNLLEAYKASVRAQKPSKHLFQKYFKSAKTPKNPEKTKENRRVAIR